VPRSSLLYTHPPEGGELTKLPLQAPTQGFQVVLADLGVLWIFVGVGQGYRDEPSLESSESASVDACKTSEEVPAACPGEALYLTLIPSLRRLLGLSRSLVLVSSKESVDTDPPSAEET
jgi:hypothetical protein